MWGECMVEARFNNTNMKTQDQKQITMKTMVTDSCVKLWLSSTDTYEWATRAGNSWPCSQLSGKRVFAEFDRNGLCDLAIDGNGRNEDCDATELSAICADHLKRSRKFRCHYSYRSDCPDHKHPAWFVAVAQFQH